MMYFKGRGECDFVVQEGTRLSEAWQVCWELAGKTGERELNGLAEARRELKIGRGAIHPRSPIAQTSNPQ